jgi:F-type H+-transporting ATPase subunit alpha
MSITDGQIIFDLGFFRKGVRPAVNAGLSVSRVGGQAQTKRQKQLSTALFKAIARYHQADEFSHFSSQLSKETRTDLARGRHLYAALMQPPEELLSLPEQQLMLETIMLSPDDRTIDVAALKKVVKERAPEANDDAAYDRIEAELLDKYAAQPLAATTDGQPAESTAAPVAGDEKPQAEATVPPKDEVKNDETKGDTHAAK